MYKIINNIKIYNSNLTGYLYIFSFLISVTLALMYIDYISHKNIVVNNRLITIKLWFFKILILLPIYIFLYELLNIILNYLILNNYLSEFLSMKLYFFNNDLNETITPDESTNNLNQINANIQDNDKNTSEQINSNIKSGNVIKKHIFDFGQVNPEKINNNVIPIIQPIVNIYSIHCNDLFNEIKKGYDEIYKSFENSNLLEHYHYNSQSNKGYFFNTKELYLTIYNSVLREESMNIDNDLNQEIEESSVNNLTIKPDIEPNTFIQEDKKPFHEKFLENFKNSKDKLNKKLSFSNIKFLMNKPLDTIVDEDNQLDALFISDKTLDDLFGSDDSFNDLFYKIEPKK